ncbi:unnamed protein product [Rotaria sordida]|uniref:Uncharacterized protein n=1 Tax=Rotaria sordida TaxID=392033 RepID=A0A815P6F9_9BILA|nr:unnamed protein product [Rotaria sordida]CAF1636958.1 unnamed protein product [Rotaria sordida]
MKQLSSIFKKEKTNPPAISRRTQLKPDEVWQNQTPTSLHEQSKTCRSLVPSSTSNDLQATLDGIVD